MKIITHTLRPIAATLVALCGTVHAAVNPLENASPGLGTLLRWLFGFYGRAAGVPGVHKAPGTSASLPASNWRLTPLIFR